MQDFGQWSIGGYLPAVLEEAGELPSFGSDAYWMAQAILLGMKEVSRASPNPTVSALVVSHNQLVTWGVTEPYGRRHAERIAIEKMPEGVDPKACTLYVTLEPCAHQGKQPPCVDAIIKSNISRVVVGAYDPHDKVSGAGVEALRQAGLTVDVEVLAEPVSRWHLPFFGYIEQQKPVFFAKWAQTLDGHLADDLGGSQWITGAKARKVTHWLRQVHDGIMVGAQTVLADHPSLTARDAPLIKRQPVKILFDPRGRLREESAAPALEKILATGKVIYLCQDPSPLREGCLTLALDARDPFFELALKLNAKAVWEYVGHGLQSIMVEGGARLLNLMFYQNLIYAAHIFIAPAYLGGQKHRIFQPLQPGGQAIEGMRRFKTLMSHTLGSDILIEVLREKEN